jgi:hypothetical protein
MIQSRGDGRNKNRNCKEFLRKMEWKLTEVTGSHGMYLLRFGEVTKVVQMIQSRGAGRGKNSNRKEFPRKMEYK